MRWRHRLVLLYRNREKRKLQKLKEKERKIREQKAVESKKDVLKSIGLIPSDKNKEISSPKFCVLIEKRIDNVQIADTK